jgi:hypothetical protein
VIGQLATTVEIEVPSGQVFRELADIERLAEWAPEFCTALRVGRTGWRILGPAGEFEAELIADERTGVILLEVREGSSAEAEMFTLWVAAAGEDRARVRLAPFVGTGRIASEVARRVFRALGAGLARLGERYSCLS